MAQILLHGISTSMQLFSTDNGNFYHEPVKITLFHKKKYSTGESDISREGG